MAELIPILDEQAAESLYGQLYRFFREEILSGRIVAGTKLPSVRHLCRSAGVSKSTVETAYQQLLAEGYLESRARSGFYVVEAVDFAGWDVLPAEGEAEVVTPPVAAVAPRYNFHGSVIDLASFPLGVWKKCMLEAMERYQGDLAFYGDKLGEYELRAEIARYLRQARTVQAVPEQVVVGTGLLQAVGSLCLLLAADVKKVAIEEPGYADVREVFEQHGMEVVPVPLEEDGLSVQLLRESGAQMVYVTPAHQYPYGMIMPIAKRMQLLEWARSTGGLILENDYDGEFRYKVKPVPSLQGLDQHGSVIYVSNFSKALSPAIRVNYMVLPLKVMERYRAFYQQYANPVSRIEQRALQLFLQNGHWERHIRKMRKVYERKQAALLQAVEEEFGDLVSVLAQAAGLHLILEVKAERSGEELAAIAVAAGVKVYPTTRNWIGAAKPAWPRLLLGFGGLSPEEIREGIQLLRHAWFPDER
ncbi:GntR family transcriptional regulator/MocR family aminotransferase [Tumebacillus sp. BK434]|uniref:MocR-like pyridoxine biosynthesis transcription factor PdxR n=1 Tax=Tumebacillus sp. BK434 TaxID=2512169 RepID=UPI00104F9660|nr:PLP-dependent aminotransferase family protein [Tumebacillus sp. BK434]TCP57576.1 GntR family transcriptional regulator/MocR family aminotransferase [Tumebacillus sp. BK434]